MLEEQKSGTNEIILMEIKNCFGEEMKKITTKPKFLDSAIKKIEGTTQGDPAAMLAYGVGLIPLLDPACMETRRIRR